MVISLGGDKPNFLVNYQIQYNRFPSKEYRKNFAHFVLDICAKYGAKLELHSAYGEEDLGELIEWGEEGFRDRRFFLKIEHRGKAILKRIYDSIEILNNALDDIELKYKDKNGGKYAKV